MKDVSSKIRVVFSKRIVKVCFGFLMILGGIAQVVLGDTFTYHPLLAIGSGVFIICLSYLRIINIWFYIIVFFINYFLISMRHEDMIKKYSIEINLPLHKNEVYIISSNSYLKWTDFLLTWFLSSKMVVNFRDRSIIHLKRGMPNFLRYDLKSINNMGYSLVRITTINHEYIVLAPLHNKGINSSKVDVNSNRITQSKVKQKIDSLEKL